MPERTPNTEPVTFSQADFIAAVADEVQVDPGLLTQRQEPEAELGDPLLAAARQVRAERQVVGVEALEAELDLRRQYDENLELLESLGLKRAIEGINGMNYPLPTYDKIQAAIAEKAAIIETKTQEGFGRLVMVPIAMPLNKLREAAEGELVRLKQAGILQEELDEANPLWAWEKYHDADENGTLVYEPKSFDANHQGQTKAELLRANQATPGWQVLLIEDPATFGVDLPREGNGTNIGGRQQFECNRSANSYLESLTTDPQYHNEVGWTPEAFIMANLAVIRQTGQPIDPETATYLTDAYFPEGGSVPSAYWHRGYRQADLYADEPDFPNADIGVRSAVRVT